MQDLLKKYPAKKKIVVHAREGAKVEKPAMTDQELKLLKGFYRSLKYQESILETAVQRGSYAIEPHAAQAIAEESSRLEDAFPQLLPPFSIQKYQIRGHSKELYDLAGIRSYLGMVLGRLESEIEETNATPVTEQRSFTFIKNAELRSILERDYQDIQNTFMARSWKAVIILCGGAIEAILLDQVSQNSASARAASSAAKEHDLNKWDLSHLIDVAVELKLITASAEKLSDAVRSYRNLVHPGNELRSGLTFGREEATIAFQILNLIHRDLSLSKGP